MNSPTRHGRLLPLDFIISGPAMAGRGWRMLDGMPGRGPFDFAALFQHQHVKLTAARAVGGYARVRSQFHARQQFVEALTPRRPHHDGTPRAT